MSQQLLSNINANHLNPQQKKAVLAKEGKILILAGAGSGKTSVIVYRIANLVKNHKVSPKNILALTFTNKAAGEMRERISQLVSKEEAKKLTMSTFHSFCLKVLREDIEHLGFTKNFTLYDEKDIKRLLKQLIHTQLEHDSQLPSLDSTIKIIEDAKTNGLSAQEVSSTSSPWHNSFVKELYQNFQVSLKAYNAVDFDHLILLTIKLFETNPQILQKYQTECKYILIDEYQDTNPLQYRLAKLLSGMHKNLCVVGDDDQSIYGWRGADIKHILQFDYDTLIKLEQNYRSSPSILKAANAVIEKNTSRHTKELWSNKASSHPIYVFHTPSEPYEAEAVVNRIIALKEAHNFKWSDFAILYRSNSISRGFESALLQASWKSDKGWQRGIPYQVFGGLELFQRAEVKDILAYLKVIANPKDQESLLRIINYPRRGIASQTLDLITTYSRKTKTPLWDLLVDIAKEEGSYNLIELQKLTPRAIKGIKGFVSAILAAKDAFSSHSLETGITTLLDLVDIKNALEEEFKTPKVNQIKWENIQEVKRALKNFGDVQAGTLSDFLNTTLLDEKKINKDTNNNEEKVNVMTIHSSKGLEFDVVFLVGLEDSIMPHEKSLEESRLDEERRLMYVAITRCRSRLYLSMSRKRTRYGKECKSTPSRFLHDIPKDMLKMTDWKFISED